MKKVIIGLLIGMGLVIGVPKSEGIQLVVGGGNIDNTPVLIAPCTTFGFSVEQTVTLPVGYNITRMVRVDRRNTGNTGYVAVSVSGGTGKLLSFDLDTLAVTEIDSFTAAIYGSPEDVAGDVFDDGILYTERNMLSGASNGFTSCSVASTFPCVTLAKYNRISKVLEVADNDIGVRRSGGSVDDMRQSGDKILTSISENGAGIRDFRTYESGSLLFSAIGVVTTAVPGIVSREYNGFNYGTIGSAGATIWQFPAGSPTSSATTVQAFGPKIVAAIYGAKNTLSGLTDLLFIESDTTGGGTATRGLYQIPALTGACASCPYSTATVFDAAYQSTFYDLVNDKVFSVRNDGTNTVKLVRTIPNFSATYIPEEIFTCPSTACAGVQGTSNGQQIADYAPQKGRIYIGSNESPVKLSKIKVCATGGPS